MAERLAARPELLDARRESVEHPFGSIKQWMGQGAFLTRRLENVRGEFSITALAYNIRRAISLVGVPALIAAARAETGVWPKSSAPHRSTEARSLFRGATGAKPPDYVGSRQIMVTQTSIPATQSFHTIWIVVLS